MYPKWAEPLPICLREHGSETRFGLAVVASELTKCAKANELPEDHRRLARGGSRTHRPNTLWQSENLLRFRFNAQHVRTLAVSEPV